MLNICDVDIFDQNLSSADSAIDTECDIIFRQNLRFVISHSQKYCNAIKKFAKRPNMHCCVQFNPDNIVSYGSSIYSHVYFETDLYRQLSILEKAEYRARSISLV